MSTSRRSSASHSSGRSPTKIEKSPPAAKNPNQPSPRINENPPAETVAQALENGQKQVDRGEMNRGGAQPIETKDPPTLPS
jgi:hypothetical protein